MKTKLRKYLAVAAILFFTINFPVSLIAQSNPAHVFFNHYDPDGTERFSQAGSTSRTASQLKVEKGSWKYIAVHVSTLASTSITVKVYGKIGLLWPCLWTKTYALATTDPEVVIVTEDATYLAVSVISTADAGGDVVSIHMEPQ